MAPRPSSALRQPQPLPVLRLSEHSATENAAAVTSYIEDCLTLGGEAIHTKGWSNEVRALLNGAPIHHDPRMSKNDLAVMKTAVTVQAIHRIWSRNKVVHSVNPHMADILASSAADRMPGSLFSKQPYSDPMFVFPQPIPVTTTNGTPGILLGFYVVGQRLVGEHRILCSTHHEDSTRARVPVGQGMFTVEDVLDRTLENYYGEEDMLTEVNQLREVLRDMVSRALGILVYTCTKQPDIVAVPPRAVRKRAGKANKGHRAPKPVRVVNLGWVLGPALDAARRVYERDAPRNPGRTGRRQRPHQRRGHMRLYWVGPGRQEPELKFIAPYEVSLDLLRPGVRPARIHPVGDELQRRA
jgi:hypothetical protein